MGGSLFWLTLLFFIKANGEPSSWIVQTARMEGAATDLRESANNLHILTQKTYHSGRISNMAMIIHFSHQLHRDVLSAKMAADVMYKSVTKHSSDHP